MLFSPLIDKTRHKKLLPDITPVGKFLRKSRLDELPQLFDILSGNMSLVGPRPERIEHCELYSSEIPEFSYRLKVRGGLTGYAQLYGKYNTTPYDKLQLDLMYIQNYSVLLDLKLLLMTIKIIFMKESTEGFDEKQISEIHFRDTEGNVFSYTLAWIEVIEEYDVHKMTSKTEEWDLTLFTCTYSGNERYTLQCVRNNQ